MATFEDYERLVRGDIVKLESGKDYVVVATKVIDKDKIFIVFNQAELLVERNFNLPDFKRVGFHRLADSTKL